MRDDESFLAAISSSPDDSSLRLVYADWLEEQGDRRAELVRLQVQLQEIPFGHPGRIPIENRALELRPAASPYWLARLDPPVWCAVGNIIDLRPSQADTPVRRGTRLFRPGAKVYLAGARYLSWLITPNDAVRGESLVVVGQHRKSRTWIECRIRVALATNWRVRLVHHPGALVRLREAWWEGFRLRPEEFECPKDLGANESLRALSEAIDSAYQRGFLPPSI